MAVDVGLKKNRKVTKIKKIKKTKQRQNNAKK